MPDYDDVERWVIKAGKAGSKLIGVVGAATTAYEVGKAGMTAYDWLTRPNPFGDGGPRPSVIYDENARQNWILQDDGSYALQSGPEMF